ncbi:hypothetical protein HHX48_15950 [Salinimonas sp. HHU 13199]|uniref:PD-(D/E)XK endonuclease-like domain-containing protein n=1 Tax=Salinimonas profundi TaxID=2729140 RepID=A0ABR8LPC8_9ALTE|nr:PD-(D/E)XK nuclease family protein [Salinimonas profundi]MBD3587233.1 hypothetical protein [Salinimonas profundi]
MNAPDFYQPGLLTITPNTRLRDAVIAKATDAKILEESVQSVKVPSVLSLADYIEKAWRNLQSQDFHKATNCALLSDTTLFYRWVDVIRKDKNIETILNPTELANQAVAANKRLAQWCVGYFDADSAESEVFKNWQKEVKRSTYGVVSTEEALLIIIEAIERGVLAVPECVCVFSFDDLPPLHEKLFQAFAKHSDVFHSDFSDINQAKPFSLSNYDDDEQLSNMAKWAHHSHLKDPKARIAIVVPDLPAKREAIVSALNEVFEPQVILPNVPSYTQPYNITAGTPLSSQPLIKTALRILRTGLEEVAAEEIFKIVNSPFIAHSTIERSRRARFDLQLRERGNTTYSLLNLTGDPACPRKLSYAIGRFANTLNNRSSATSLAQWLTLFDDSLEAIGWPGERNLNSEEFQALKQFKELLLELSGNFTFEADISVDDALFYLLTACNNTLYSPETKETPIQVMGLLEAAGLRFDKMLVLDMNMGTVPAKASPNTFLPLQLQIDHKMPHADANRELSFFESILSRYSRNCTEIVYSYCQYQHESELTPSYFVSGDVAPVEWFNAPSIDYQSYLLHRIPVQTEFDDPAPIDTSRKARGGVSILQKETLCPFMNFMDNRLRVKDFPKVRDGLSASVRGQLLHDIMARIWKVLRAQADLLELNEEQQHLLVSQKIDESFIALRGRHDIDESLLKMEKSSFNLIVNQWLDFEKTRPPFMVEAIEEDRTVILGDKLRNEDKESAGSGSISISIRLDRIDCVQDEKKQFTPKVPIDYKSGSLSMKISPTALRDVQLPLAAISEPSDVCGVAYAGIKKNAIKMLGVSDGTDVGKGVVPTEKARLSLSSDFKEALDHWKSQLNLIAKRFIAGAAQVTPSTDACRYCKKNIICRS